MDIPMISTAMSSTSSPEAPTEAALCFRGEDRCFIRPAAFSSAMDFGGSLPPSISRVCTFHHLKSWTSIRLVERKPMHFGWKGYINKINGNNPCHEFITPRYKSRSPGERNHLFLLISSPRAQKYRRKTTCANPLVIDTLSQRMPAPWSRRNGELAPSNSPHTDDTEPTIITKRHAINLALRSKQMIISRVMNATEQILTEQKKRNKPSCTNFTHNAYKLVNLQPSGPWVNVSSRWKSSSKKLLSNASSWGLLRSRTSSTMLSSVATLHPLICGRKRVVRCKRDENKEHRYSDRGFTIEKFRVEIFWKEDITHVLFTNSFLHVSLRPTLAPKWSLAQWIVIIIVN